MRFLLSQHLIDEESLWQRLDWALEEAFSDRKLAWQIAWNVALDAKNHKEIKEAATALLAIL